MILLLILQTKLKKNIIIIWVLFTKEGNNCNDGGLLRTTAIDRLNLDFFFAIFFNFHFCSALLPVRLVTMLVTTNL